MKITFYSFLMAIVSSTLLIIAVFFLKKTQFFANPFGVYLMGIMYIFPIVRLFLPYRIPFFTFVIEDKYILAPVMDVLCNRNELTREWPVLALNVLVGVMLCVSFAMFVFYSIKQYIFIRSVWRLKNYADDHEKAVLSCVSKNVFQKKHRIKLIKTPTVSTPIVLGFVHNVILLPYASYSDTQLEMIFMHECMHLKNNDLWVKFFINLYYCVFWWNPAMYLMKKDVDFILELKCDNLVYDSLDDFSKLDYAQVINDCARKVTDKNKAVMFSAFASKDATHLHSYRLNNLLNRGKNKSFKVEIALSLFFVFLCVMSLFVSWQPCYDAEDNTYDYSNVYLVENETGYDVVCCEKHKSFVFKEDVEQGLYENYPVKSIDKDK